MNNSKLWLVVKPTVGVPIFLSAVAIGSFAVHVAVLTSTGWVGDFLQGDPLGTTSASLIDSDSNTSHASYDAEVIDGTTVMVTLPDGTKAKAVLDMTETVASIQQ
jgi:light-harvesting protein B-800-850 alpha chain